jgi:hypothetical protein
MTRFHGRRLLLGIILGALAPAAMPGEDIPVTNWKAPLSEYRKAGDLTNPTPFIPVDPCRLLDTRGNGFTGAYGPPSMAAGVTRNFDLDSAPTCGLPAGRIGAYSLNITVTNTAGPGVIKIYPQGGVQPVVSTLNYVAGQTIANAAIVPAGTGGGITVVAGVSGCDLIIDVNGYFYDGDLSNELLPGEFFAIIGRFTNGGVLYPWNREPTGANAYGLNAFSDSTGTGSAGVHGRSNAATGQTYGVFGDANSTGTDTAGVLGVDNNGRVGATFGYRSAGVRGESNGDIGVLGLAGPGGLAVAGQLFNVLGGVVAEGYLGINSGGTDYGVFSQSNFGGSGAKFFVEPHPYKADMVIRYVALEGPESGTYFRGRGKFQNGLATIEVPEDFRMVTDSEGLSIQVTPIGQMATVAVMTIGLDRIVVKGSRSVEFFYTVNGVRKTHKHLRPVGPGQEYMPASSEATMPLWLTEGQKQMLISNGTYTAEGKVNRETAKALGWDQVWEERTKAKKAEASTKAGQQTQE